MAEDHGDQAPSTAQPIVDIQQAKDLGLIKEGAPGSCFGELYSEQAPECQLCYESDRCAQRFIERAGNYVIPISQFEKDARTPVPAPVVFKAPGAFEEFENKLLALPRVARFPRQQSVLYLCRDRRMLSLMEPMSEDSLTVSLHGCQRKNIKDPNRQLWTTDKYPGKVFLFAMAGDIKMAMDIITQHYRHLEAENKKFNLEKFANVKSKIKTDTL